MIFSSLLADEIDTFFGTIKQPAALEPYGKNGGLIVFISNILNLLMIAGGLIALFNIIMAGYTYLTSAGDAKAHEKVLSKLNTSLWGLVLMVMAPALMAVMGWVLFKQPGFFLKPNLTPPQTENEMKKKETRWLYQIHAAKFQIVSPVYAQGGDKVRGPVSGEEFDNPLGGNKQITGPGASVFQPDLSAGANAGGKPVEKFLSVFLGFFTIVGGLMFLMYFVFGGLAWLSAGGEKGKVESARTQLTNAAIGLIIVVVSQAIIGIVSGVLGLNILNPASVLGGLFKL